MPVTPQESTNLPEPPVPVSCDGCGVCCYLQHVPPFMPTELDRLPANLAAEVASARESKSAPCIWLTADKRCRHYTHRPEVCRQFELGSEDCHAIRKTHYQQLTLRSRH